MQIVKIKGTVGFVTKKRTYVIQFSLKDPWLCPHKDKHFLYDTYTLYGWLFFYFGWLN